MLESIGAVSKRENQIMRYGCPECGQPYDIIVSDKEGTLFQCSNRKCKSGRPRVPYKNASKACPKDDNVIGLVVRRRQAAAELEYTKDNIAQVLSAIADTKQKSGEQQKQMMKCREAYRNVRDLKLFDKKGKRVYDAGHPYLVCDPIHDEISEIGNIRQKRRAHTMLLSRWWVSKEKYNDIIKKLQNLRGTLMHLRQERMREVAVISAIDSRLGKHRRK